MIVREATIQICKAKFISANQDYYLEAQNTCYTPGIKEIVLHN